MKINHKTKMILMILLSVIFVMSLTSAFLVVTYNKDSLKECSVQYSVSNMFGKNNEEYYAGHIYNVPDRTIDGEKAIATLTFPDGKSTLKTREVELNQSGIYTITYNVVVNGVVKTEKEHFTVYEKSFISGNSSKIHYGKHPKAKDKEGLIVSLAEGEELYVSSVIDVSDVTKYDTLLEFFVTPTVTGVGKLELGKLEFTHLDIVFTDVVNPEDYIKVKIQRVDAVQHGLWEGADETVKEWAFNTSYALAGASGQTIKGRESSSKIHINNEWGTGFAHNFYGVEGEDGYLDDNTARLSYDAKENAMYINGTRIVKFDDPNDFTDVWKGFTSGKVRVSMTAGGYQSGNKGANFVISTIKDTDLVKEKIEDNDAPIIEVISPDGEIVNGKVGEYYPVYDIKVSDVSTVKKEINVYYKEQGSKYSVEIKNNKFYVEKPGDYFINYKVTDVFGNYAVKEIKVVCKNGLPDVDILFDSEPDIEYDLGERINLLEYTAVGGVGKTDVKCFYEFNSKRYVFPEGGFIVEETGPYKIIYQVTDFIGQTKEISYWVVAFNRDKAIFSKPFDLPKYFICGSEYILKDYYVYKYKGNEKYTIPAEICVTDKNGSKILKQNETYVPEVNNDGDLINVKYSVGSDFAEFNIPGINVIDKSGNIPKLLMEKYFYSEDATYIKSDDGIEVVANSQNTKAEFIKRQIAYGFELILNTVPEKSDFSSVKFSLVDSVESDIKVNFEIERQGNSAYLLFEGNKTIIGSQFEVGGDISQTRINVSYIDGMIKVNDNIELRVNKCADGSKFVDFKSGFIYITAEFNNAESGSAIKFNKINGQFLSNATFDTTRPKIVAFGEYGNAVGINVGVKIPVFLVEDTLDPKVEVKMTVTSPTGKKVVSTKGETLDGVKTDKEYWFIADEYGNYNVLVSARDTFSGKKEDVNYVVMVEDRVIPTIKFTSEIKQEINSGEVIVIPDYEVHDDKTEDKNIIVQKFIVTPSGNMIELTGNSNSFKPSQKGVYEVVINAVDEAGNILYVSKNISVK